MPGVCVRVNKILDCYTVITPKVCQIIKMLYTRVDKISIETVAPYAIVVASNNIE